MFPLIGPDQWIAHNTNHTHSGFEGSRMIHQNVFNTFNSGWGNYKKQSLLPLVVKFTIDQGTSVFYLRFPACRHGTVLMETIKKGIHDADAEARSVARK